MPTINNFYNITNQHNRVGADIIRPRNPEDFIDTHYTNYILSEASYPLSLGLRRASPPTGEPDGFHDKFQFSLYKSTTKIQNSRNSNPVAAVSFY